MSRDKRIKLLPKFKMKTDYNQNKLHYDQKKIKLLFQAIKSKNKISFKNMYDRNTGKNINKIKFNFKKPNIIIF